MLTQRAPRTTQECSADQPRRLQAAGAGRGNGQRPPICVSYPQPGDSNQGQQEESCRLRTRIDRLLQAIDMPRCWVGSPVWEDLIITHNFGMLPEREESEEGAT